MEFSFPEMPNRIAPGGKVGEAVRNAVADTMKKAGKNNDGVLSEEEARSLFPLPPRRNGTRAAGVRILAMNGKF